MKVVLPNKSKTIKEKCIKIFPPTPPPFKPTYICAQAMPGAKKGQQIVPKLKRRQGFAPLGTLCCSLNSNHQIHSLCSNTLSKL